MKSLAEEEFIKCQNDTLYWYNTYVRKESEPVLTQEEWDTKRQGWQDARDQQLYQQYRRHSLSNDGTFYETIFKDYES